MFNGEGKSILISGTSGYFGKYSYDTDDDNNPTFTTKLVFGLNGTYTYKLSDDKKTAELTNTDTKAVSTLKKTDDTDFIPTPDKDASIDENLVGCWMSDSGEYLCFDKSGIMYQNLLTICLHIQTTRQAKVKLFQHTQPPTKKQQINTHTLLTATLLHLTVIHTQEFLSAI